MTVAARDWRFWALLALFGLVVGLHLATPRLDSDQAVTGLMGWQVLRGEFPIFFWAQHHAGVPEAYGAAVTFFVFGMSRLALSLVPALAALGLALLLYRTGAVLFGHGAGLLAILFAAVVSPYVVAHYERARAYYIEHLVLGHVVLLGAALWLRDLTPGPASPGLGEAARCRILIAMGLAGGLGLYCGFQIVDAVLPALLALLLVNPRLPLRRGAWLGLGAFVVGAAPFWIYNVTHQWATFVVGQRFQARISAGEAGSYLFRELLPVILGVKEWIESPPFLPWPATLVVPALVLGAVLLLVAHAGRALPRLRRRHDLAGEAFLVTAALVVVGVVWYGRYVQVPRYLLPLSPILALILARACQLAWRWSRPATVVAAGFYLVAVGVGLVGDLPALRPARWTAYWSERAETEALFAFLRGQGIDRAYAYDYWVAPRLTFDAGERIIVAEPFNDRYRPYTQAVDASRRPAYVLRNNVERFEIWMRGLQARVRRMEVGPYTVFWDFEAPPEVAPLPRAGWSIRTSAGRGAPETLVDGRLRSGWASARGPHGSAAVALDFGRPRLVSGVTMMTDRPGHGPDELEVAVDDGQGGSHRVTTLPANGFTILWRNGAPRTVPGRSLTVRFPPVETRQLRLTDLGPGGIWAVAELFALTPAAGGSTGPPSSGIDALVGEGRRLEQEGRRGPALVRYRQAMRLGPDDPSGYTEFARLAADLPRVTSAAEQAARYAELGLVDEARETYAGLAAVLGQERTYAELTRRRAELAAAAGDAAEARVLAAEATAVAAPRARVGAVLGRVVELTGYDLATTRVWPGDALDMTYHWRLLAAPPEPLAVYVHFRMDAASLHSQFGDDHALPEPVPGLAPTPQHVSERRRVPVPLDTKPGRYRLVAGVWNPASGSRLHRWWKGVLPTLETTIELGTVEVLSRP